MKNVIARSVGAALSVFLLTGRALGQVPSEKLDPAINRLDPPSNWIAWAIAGVFALGIILITFKSSKRSHLE